VSDQTDDTGDDAPQETWRAVLRHHGGEHTTVAVTVEHRGRGVLRAWLGGTNWWGEGATAADAVTAMAVAYGAREPYTLAEVVPPGGETQGEQLARMREEVRQWGRETLDAQERLRVSIGREMETAGRLLDLRCASRALAGIDAATLDAVTPAAMRAVMERRGWRLDARLPWFGDPMVTAFESWEHATAQGAGSCGGFRTVPTVQVMVLPGADADEHRRYVAEWAWSLATRHGDVSPAEVLAEALAAGVAK